MSSDTFMKQGSNGWYSMTVAMTKLTVWTHSRTMVGVDNPLMPSLEDQIGTNTGMPQCELDNGPK